MKKILIYFLFWVNVNAQPHFDQSIHLEGNNKGIGEGQIVGLEVIDQLETTISLTAVKLKFRLSQQKNYTPKIQTIEQDESSFNQQKHFQEEQ